MDTNLANSRFACLDRKRSEVAGKVIRRIHQKGGERRINVPNRTSLNWAKR